MSNVIAISDVHFPYADQSAIKEVYKAIKIEQPEVVIQLGDLYDQYVFGRYDRDLNVISPEEELSRGRKQALKFWSTIRKLVPKARLIQLSGNHDMRMTKKIMSKAPEFLGMVEKVREEYYNFPGVEFHSSDRDFVEIDNVIYCHGWMTTAFSHVNYFGKSVVRAHSHRTELECRQGKKTNNKFLFEMACGHLLDETVVPFNYTTSKFTNWTQGYGVIVDGQPFLEVLDEKRKK